MIRINEITKYDVEIIHFTGLSSDTKPINTYFNHYLNNGCSFLEVNTGNYFLYDEENQKWHQQSNSPSITEEQLHQIDVNKQNIQKLSVDVKNKADDIEMMDNEIWLTSDGSKIGDPISGASHVWQSI